MNPISQFHISMTDGYPRLNESKFGKKTWQTLHKRINKLKYIQTTDTLERFMYDEIGNVSYDHTKIHDHM